MELVDEPVEQELLMPESESSEVSQKEVCLGEGGKGEVSLGEEVPVTDTSAVKPI